MAKKDKKLQNMRKPLYDALCTIGDYVKVTKSGNLRIKVKGKDGKKVAKKLKRNCLHWTILKKKLVCTNETVEHNGEQMYKCAICKRKMPMDVWSADKVSQVISDYEQLIDMTILYSVNVNPSKDDIASLLTGRKLISNNANITKAVFKSLKKAEEIDNNKNYTDSSNSNLAAWQHRIR